MRAQYSTVHQLLRQMNSPHCSFKSISRLLFLSYTTSSCRSCSPPLQCFHSQKEWGRANMHTLHRERNSASLSDVDLAFILSRGKNRVLLDQNWNQEFLLIYFFLKKMLPTQMVRMEAYQVSTHGGQVPTHAYMAVGAAGQKKMSGGK